MPGVPAHERLLTISAVTPAVGRPTSRWRRWRPRLTRTLVVAGALLIDLWVWGGDTRLWSGESLPGWGLVVGLTLCVLGYAVLALWRSPIPGYTALWVLSFAGLIVPSLESLAGFLVALFLMARMTPRPVARTALLGSAVPIMVNTVTGVSFHDATEVFTLINAGLWTVLMLVVWSAGVLAGRSERRLATERRWAEDARTETLALERLKISREVHDTVGHGLSGIVLQAAGARAGLARGTLEAGDIDAALAAIQQAGEQSMRELHLLLGLLREPDTHPAESRSIEGVTQLVDTARASGLDVRLTQTGTPADLDLSIARAAYRVLQEALSNVMKHGGSGAVVDVEVEWGPERLSLTVHNTPGSEAPQPGSTERSHPPEGTGGYGLVGLRERLTLLHATLEAGPVAHGGYRLRARLPLTLSFTSDPTTEQEPTP